MPFLLKFQSMKCVDFGQQLQKCSGKMNLNEKKKLSEYLFRKQEVERVI